jgi:predicted NUDIX family NTP pyrophosphohydrolase
MRHGECEVFPVHPGGPFRATKDDGAWAIPKGVYADGDDPLTTAKREFQEETGFDVSGQFRALSPLKPPNGKVISAWAVEADVDPASITRNTFLLEWLLESGKTQQDPEVDRAM